ncbi:helix-turn-helix domain-containing protein [Ammonicoccus fulvus]|uniref:Helix-turn-helix domain-containing protein n=1 Tax=Ammonicoccus fulvus TaxID=3138240 RepID=A0ABZ3FK97_9ACTN
MTSKVTKLEENGRSVLGRVFVILECFTLDQPEQTISDLCDQTGLPPATVHRILANLIEWEAVERTSRGCYRLGHRMWRIGAGVPSVHNWRTVARPTLIDLHKETGAMTALSNREGDVMILVDIFGGHQAVEAWTPSRPIGLPNCASGRVLLAFGDNASADEILNRLPADRAFELRRHLADVRRMGFSIVRHHGATWLASPVFDQNGRVEVALAMRVVGELGDPAALALRLVEAARQVSRDLGWRGDRRRDRGRVGLDQGTRRYA